MCVIAAKPQGTEMPTTNEIANMWNRNPDGAGLMYALGGKVHIEKGFMDYATYRERLDQLDDLYGLKDLAVVMHFRITTHGGTKPENTHPFPISDSLGMLKKLKLTTDVGVAHNGIIPVTPRTKDISDTMEYIAGQLAPLKKAMRKFYEDKNLMEMIKNATESRLAFLTGDSKIYTVGNFVEHNGIMYSNKSYETDNWRNYYLGSYESGKWKFENNFNYETMTEKNLMWLDEGKAEFVLTEEGEFGMGVYAIDKDGIVYELDEYDYIFYPMYGYTAYTGEGTTLKYNYKSKSVTREVVANY